VLASNLGTDLLLLSYWVRVHVQLESWGTAVKRALRWQRISRCALSLSLLALSSCAYENALRARMAVARMNSVTSPLHWTLTERRIVLLAPYFIFTDSGRRRDDWNQVATVSTFRVVTDELSAKGLELVVPDLISGPSKNNFEPTAPGLEGCLRANVLDLEGQLPSTCGELLRNRYRADYALFISAGATLGSFPAIPPSSHSFHAVLLDLRTGSYVWSHTDRYDDWHAGTSTEDPVHKLLEGFPPS